MKQDDIATVPAGLARLCRVVRAGAAFGAVATLVLPVWFWLTPEWVAALGARMADIGCTAIHVDARALALGLAISVLPLAVGVYLLVQLWRLFGEYGRGRALTEGAQRHLSHFARALLVLALLQPVVRAGLSVVLTLGNPPGQRQLVLSLSGDDYLMALVAAALVAIAAVMRQAVAAADENRRFV